MQTRDDSHPEFSRWQKACKMAVSEAFPSSRLLDNLIEEGQKFNISGTELETEQSMGLMMLLLVRSDVFFKQNERYTAMGFLFHALDYLKKVPETNVPDDVYRGFANLFKKIGSGIFCDDEKIPERVAAYRQSADLLSKIKNKTPIDIRQLTLRYLFIDAKNSTPESRAKCLELIKDQPQILFKNTKYFELLAQWKFACDQQAKTEYIASIADKLKHLEDRVNDLDSKVSRRKRPGFFAETKNLEGAPREAQPRATRARK